MSNQRISVPHTCRQCDKTFYPLKASKGWFCSNHCKFQAKRIIRTVTCAGCGITFTKPAKPRAKYCTNKCYQATKRQRTLIERLDNITVVGNCWEWQGNRNALGYGRVYYNGSTHLAARLMFELIYGDLGDKIVRHFVCDNPPCVNPYHLRSGDQMDNMNDCVRHKRHAHGETSYAKLTDALVIEIRKSGKRDKDWAKELGVARKTVNNARLGVTWKHL